MIFFLTKGLSDEVRLIYKILRLKLKWNKYPKRTMDIVKAFKNIPIKVQGTHEEPLFRASDIGVVLEMTNIRASIGDFDETEKVVHKVHTKGGPQDVIFLTVKGLKKVICNSRKPNAIDLAKQLGINMFDNFYIPLETSLVHFLQEVYKEEKIILQHTVGPYKIDLYFSDYKLAIECDEYFHMFQKEDDIKREMYIKEKLGCEIIRFKQDKKNKHFPELLNKINKIIEKKKLNKLRYEIMNLNTKLDIYNYADYYYCNQGEYSYIDDYGLREAGYETPDSDE